jgi:hypothetical protein
MTEQKLHERVVALRQEVDWMLSAALTMPATIELCVFTGKLGAVFDVLLALEQAGVPVHEPDEEPHVLAPQKKSD